MKYCYCNQTTAKLTELSMHSLFLGLLQKESKQANSKFTIRGNRGGAYHHRWRCWGRRAWVRSSFLACWSSRRQATTAHASSWTRAMSCGRSATVPPWRAARRTPGRRASGYRRSLRRAAAASRGPPTGAPRSWPRTVSLRALLPARCVADSFPTTRCVHHVLYFGAGVADWLACLAGSVDSYVREDEEEEERQQKQQQDEHEQLHLGFERRLQLRRPPMSSSSYS